MLNLYEPEICNLHNMIKYNIKIQTNEAIFLLRSVDNVICSGHKF